MHVSIFKMFQTSEWEELYRRNRKGLMYCSDLHPGAMSLLLCVLQWPITRPFVSGCAASAAFIKQTATWNEIVYWTSWQIKTKLYVSNMKYGKYGKLCKVLLRHFKFSKFIASHTVQHESNKLGYNSKFDVYFQPSSFFWHSVFRWTTSNLF